MSSPLPPKAPRPANSPKPPPPSKTGTKPLPPPLPQSNTSIESSNNNAINNNLDDDNGNNNNSNNNEDIIKPLSKTVLEEVLKKQNPPKMQSQRKLLSPVPPPPTTSNNNENNINSEELNNLSTNNDDTKEEKNDSDKISKKKTLTIVKGIPKKIKDKLNSFGLNMKEGIVTNKNDTRLGLIFGTCHCQSIKYELLEVPEDIQHCYCSMCRKMHGSPVATWCPIKENDIKWLSKTTLTNYQSSEHVIRSFCSKCGSNVSLKYSFQSEVLWITPALFDVYPKNWYNNCRVLHIFCTSKCEWYTIPYDNNPQLSDDQMTELDVTPDLQIDIATYIPKKLPNKKKLSNNFF